DQGSHCGPGRARAHRTLYFSARRPLDLSRLDLSRLDPSDRLHLYSRPDSGTPMKKFAIGCGIVLVLAAIAAGLGSWYVIHKVKDTFAGFADLAKVPDIEKSVASTTVYAPPDSGELTEAQVTRFLAVQDHVKQTLGAKFT